RSDVTDASGAVPEVGPEIIIPSGANFDSPTVDGALSEDVWMAAPGIDLRFDDEDLRNSYPAIGPWRSGQWQPEIDGARAAVLDPADATVKWFFKENMLYLGVDVRDQAVWSLENFDQWDGIRFVINDRKEIDPNQTNSIRHELIMRFDPAGGLIKAGYLPFLIDSLHGGEAAVQMKANTTINDYNDVDEGYTFELALDLTKFGYPAENYDGVLLISACLFDGENFENAADNYGNRVWWMRESVNPAGPAWAYMDPTAMIGTGVAEGHNVGTPETFALVGNYPNPFNPTTNIVFTMPEEGLVTLKVYDILGRNVVNLPLGLQNAGKQQITFDAHKMTSGVYFYRLHMKGNMTKNTHSTVYGKFTLLK
ncbi:MAG: T9SS C-terminal target domain-containing protein, partial [Calditrichaeota bacterium]